MKQIKVLSIILSIAYAGISCEKDNSSDHSGVYCLNVQNMEMTIIQSENNITFTLQNDFLTNGTGIISGDTLSLTATTSGEEIFISTLLFAGDGSSFAGPYQIKDIHGNTTMEGFLHGIKGKCIKYDIEINGIPKFIKTDFTQLAKIEKISKFRSGFGHSYTDGSEECRSMKHYYTPYIEFRENNNIEVYSPVKGTIVAIMNDSEGGPSGLKNVELHIRPDDQPAFIINIFHCDLISADIAVGKKVQAGELIGFARMYYENWGQYVTSFDIALWVSTPSGMRLIPYFEAMSDGVFNAYASRRVANRQEFTITKEDRDAHPLECNGETFTDGGSLENWIILQ